MKKIVLAALFTLVLVSSAQADLTGAGEAGVTLQLTKINAILHTKYAAIVKQLEEAKAQSAFLQSIVDNGRIIKREYDFVRNFRLEGIIKEIEQDLDGLTSLDDINDYDNEDRFTVMLNEIDRRFDAGDPAEKKTKAKLTNRVKEMQRLQTLLKAKLDEADRLASQDANIKDLQGSMATTNCLLLSLEIQRRQREIMKEQQNIDDQIEMDNKVSDFRNALRKMGKGAASMD